MNSLDYDWSDNKVTLKQAIYALSVAREQISNDNSITNNATFASKSTYQEDDDDDLKEHVIKKKDGQASEFYSFNQTQERKVNNYYEEDDSSSSSSAENEDGGELGPHSLTIDSHWSEFYTVIGRTATRRCIVCNRILRGTDAAIDHVNSHTGLKPYQCSFCPTVFSCRRNMLAHERAKHHVGRKRKSPRGRKKVSHRKSPAAAATKSKSTSSWKNYEDFTSNEESSSDHDDDPASSNHEDDDPTSEDLSDLIVSQPFNGKDVHVCSICKKIFGSLPNALAHVKSHCSNNNNNNHQQDMHQCTTCDRQFSSGLALMGHQQCHSQNPIKTRKGAYKCKICHNSYLYRSTLNRHMLQQHPGGTISNHTQQQRRVVDTKKSRVITSTSILKNRSRRQEGGTPRVNNSSTNSSTSSNFIIKKGRGRFSCTFCQKIFPSFANALRHERIHTGERPFACSYENCTMTFIDNWSLYKHNITHTGKALFPCPICTEGFTLKYLLKDHMTTHDDDMETAEGDDENVPKISMVYSLTQKDGPKLFGGAVSDADNNNNESSSRDEQGIMDPLGGIIKQDDDNEDEWSDSEEEESIDPLVGIRATDADDNDEEDESLDNNIRIGASISGRQRQRIISKKFLQFSPPPASKCLTRKLNRDGKAVYKCKFCDKEFRFPSHAQRHVRIHTGEKPFPCSFPNCDQAFLNNYERVRHVQAVHSGEEKGTSRKTSFTYRSRNNQTTGGISDYGGESESSDSDSWKDDTATTTCYDKLSPYVSCEVADDGSILYICNFCKKRFKSNNHAVAHTRVHTGDCPYVCSCGKSFSQGGSLNRHRKSYGHS